MNIINSKRTISWFGKLPCVGDFCSHNMPAKVCEALDNWLSEAMQVGQETHGDAWTRAYFQTPMHGFVLGKKALPALEDNLAVGVIMPSVDKAGRAFPFVLMEQLPAQNEAGEPSTVLNQHIEPQTLTDWFSHAYGMCAAAMNDEWTLDKLANELQHLPKVAMTVPTGQNAVSNDCHSTWFRIEFDGQVNWVMQCRGLPKADAFETLIGMGIAL
ncbi:type VI secretion system-associated protein TagF [Limnobacter parvus]|uniref:Type VI secretion system-associated protein TagF n=1 Tax=Limnobacter parvus TaxID=2939690 RepID=A0ABT1XLN1_9BURK|nr:type VI secretion system-associated protein TagF [Limnobacter parvus]MCR2747167.1 type VI secretion system-associated protein TagF [Limnobacter parvus]